MRPDRSSTRDTSVWTAAPARAARRTRSPVKHYSVRARPGDVCEQLADRGLARLPVRVRPRPLRVAGPRRLGRCANRSRSSRRCGRDRGESRTPARHLAAAERPQTGAASAESADLASEQPPAVELRNLTGLFIAADAEAAACHRDPRGLTVSPASCCSVRAIGGCVLGGPVAVGAGLGGLKGLLEASVRQSERRCRVLLRFVRQDAVAVCLSGYVISRWFGAACYVARPCRSPWTFPASGIAGWETGPGGGYLKPTLKPTRLCVRARG